MEAINTLPSDLVIHLHTELTTPSSNTKISQAGADEAADKGPGTAGMRVLIKSPLGKAQSMWLLVRKRHLFWEITFAVLLAVYFGYYFAGERSVSKIYILIGDDIPNTTGEVIRNSLKAPGMSLTVNGTAVNAEIVEVQSNRPSAAIAKAQDIVANGDALAVVGILDSQPTEQSLKFYLHQRPQIPFIATVQSNGNLLKECDDKCFDRDRPVPLLQLSPTNADEARWVIKFATDHNVKSFLIVNDDRSANQSYIQGLTRAYDEEIPATYVHVGAPVSNLTNALSSEPDCILFAGDPGNAQVLLQAVEQAIKSHPKRGHRWTPTVILSDTAVPPIVNSVSYTRAVNLTDQSDASYYSDPDEPNAYGLDGVTIAAYLIKELDNRGLDWEFSLKSKLLNRTNAKDLRRNLVRLMQQDFRFHAAYRGAEETGPVKGLSTVYSFDCPAIRQDGTIERKADGGAEYCQRYGGIFHVWLWEPRTHEMIDVDAWHPQRQHQKR